MKYTVFINQKAVIDNDFDLDFNDMAIFDLMKDASNGPRIKKMFFDDCTYYEFRWKWIIQQLPMLKIKTRQGINKRIQKLIDAEIVIGYPNNSAENTAFFRFGRNYELFIYADAKRVNKNLQPVNESYQTCKQEFTQPVNESLHNKKINNKNNKTSKFIAPTESEVIEYFKEHGQTVELAKKAFKHYQIGEWHDANGRKVKNWKQKMHTNWFKDKKTILNQGSLFQESTVSNYSLTDD